MRFLDVTADCALATDRNPDGAPIDDGRSRGPGIVNVSDVVKRIAPYEEDPANYEQPWLRAWLGFIWERVLESLERVFAGAVAGQRQVVRPPEMELDGIYGHPDGLDLGSGCLEEYKLTWVSARNAVSEAAFAKKFARWLLQVAMYCKMLGVVKVRFWIFWVNGDYSWKPPFGRPFVGVYEIEFTQEEVDDTWELARVQRKAILEERNQGG